MFKREQCRGCRKFKFFVKYREVYVAGANVKALSEDKLCRKCGRIISKAFKRNG